MGDYLVISPFSIKKGEIVVRSSACAENIPLLSTGIVMPIVAGYYKKKKWKLIKGTNANLYYYIVKDSMHGINRIEKMKKIFRSFLENFEYPVARKKVAVNKKYFKQWWKDNIKKSFDNEEILNPYLELEDEDMEELRKVIMRLEENNSDGSFMNVYFTKSF